MAALYAAVAREREREGGRGEGYKYKYVYLCYNALSPTRSGMTTLPRAYLSLYLFFSLTPSPAEISTIQQDSPSPLLGSSPVRVTGRPAVYLARARLMHDTRRISRAANSTLEERDGSWMDMNKRTAIVASLPLAAPIHALPLLRTLGEILGSLDSGGQERETITPRIGLETESAASRRAMPARDWTAGRVFYQEHLSARRAPREMTREKTNAGISVKKFDPARARAPIAYRVPER